MTNTEKTPDAASDAGATGQGLPPLVINTQYVKDLSFENPNAPRSLLEQKEPPTVQINVDVRSSKMGADVYEVSLAVQAQAKHKGDTVFVVELVYGGIFTLRGIPDEQIQPVLLVECPRLLFPFARAVISETTRDGGYAPLMIHPIDFAKIYISKLNQAA